MKNAIALLFLAVCLFTNPASAQQNPGIIPANKKLSRQWIHNLYSKGKKTVYRGNQLKTIGMPIGGIASGQLYIRGDGTLARWWFANNAYNTGYGAPSTNTLITPFGKTVDCYNTYTPESYVDQGFKISIATASGKIFNKKLNKKDFDDISFNGEYPIATVNYSDKHEPLPLSISMKAFSPFIPLDARESATPGTYLVFTLKNTGMEKLKVNLTGWLQNMVCQDLKGKATGLLRDRAVIGKESSSLLMDLVEDKNPATPAKKETIFDDFEDGNYSNWTITGSAFSNKPANGTLPDQNPVSGYSGDYLVNSFNNGDDSKGTMTSKPFTINSQYLNFLIGGGNKPGKTCLNLLVDGKVVFSETGDDNEALSPKGWDVSVYKGKTAQLQIVDDATGPWGHINVDRITFSDRQAGLIDDITSHPYFGNVSLTVLNPDAQVITNIDNSQEAESTKKLGEKLVGEVGVNISIAPGEQREVVYLLTWYFPNRPKDYDGGGWSLPLNASGPAIGNMYSKWYSSSQDVAKWMTDNRKRLFALTNLFHDSYYNNSTLPNWLNDRIMMPVSTLATETCQWWANNKFWAWEGVGSCDGTCTHVWTYEQALSHLFPELERNVREKTDFSTSFQADGGVMTRNGTGGVMIDGHAGTILKSYREYLMSDNRDFLNRNWDKIKKATQYIIRQDAMDGKTDGIIEGEQPNTYDVAFYGANTYVGSLYLAALESAQKMALLQGDKVFADSCKMLYESGRSQTVKRLWNGRYFIQDVDLKAHPRDQYATGCLADQVFGQTWAHLLNLEYVYPEGMVKKALASVWQNNWTTDVGAYNKIHKPDRFYASNGEAGLMITTWPKGGFLDKGVIYKNEVWTGVEYQVATNMIYDGMLTEGLSVLRGLHDRYSPEKHNPWNEIECGDHYARALASWGVLLALEDYDYNGPEGKLSFAPKLTPQNFEGFFTTAKGWGNLLQHQKQGVQTDELQLKYGTLQLKQFRVTLASNAAPKEVSLYSNGKKVAVKWIQTGQKIVLDGFDETINAGQNLKVEIKI